MKLPRPLIPGRLVRRYKRFLADVELEDGTLVTAHTANPGAMTGLTTPGSPVLLSHHDVATRKLKHTWELLRVGRTWAGINPARTNALVEEAIASGVIAELAGYPERRREVACGGSRLDLRLAAPDRPPCWVEVKNVTLVEGKGALFPDAVTERGRRHLHELAARAALGERAVLCFVVQRADVRWVSPADAVDPRYGAALREVLAAGVEVLAYQARVRATRGEIRLVRRLPVCV